MKLFTFLFVALFFLCNEKGLAETKDICAFEQSVSLLEPSKNNIKKESSYKIIDSDSHDGIPLKQKKRNRKGVKPMLFCLFNDVCGKINTTEGKSILLEHTCYYFSAFPGNGKRGPPSSFYIS